MFVIYNGVVLDVISTEGVEREFVYSQDETTLLYTKWTVSVVALVNPKVSGSANGYSVVGADKIIRAKLSEPRKKLYIIEASAGTGKPLVNSPTISTLQTGGPAPDATTGTNTSGTGTPNANSGNTDGTQTFQSPYEVLLECPYGNIGTDAKDGPTPLHYDITAVQGVMSYMVRFVIQCYVSPEFPTQTQPTPGTSLAPSPVAAHRWKMSIGATDQSYFTVRKIIGTVTFRKDMMKGAKLSPEDWRAFLAHPIPVGYKRMPPQCDLSEDETTLVYTITDVQQATNFDPFQSGATDINITESISFERANLGIGGSSGSAIFGLGGLGQAGGFVNRNRNLIFGQMAGG